jgi:DegV family protein with EDD domain
VLDTAEYLRRGGRASAFTAAIGDLLQIKVMLEVAAGNVLPLAKLRTRARARDDLAARIAALGPLERLAVMHVACLDGAADMANRLADQSATPPVVAEVTSVIGTHAGPGTVGVAAVRAA